MSGAGFSVLLGLEGIPDASAKLDGLAPKAQTALRISVSRQTIQLQNGVKAAIEQIFHSDGPLYQGVQSQIEEVTGQVTGRVHTSGVAYDFAQEYGGTWQIPEIFPVNAKALCFGAPAKVGFSSGAITTGTIFAMHTKAHPVTLPARSYARSTLFRMKPQIEADVAASTQANI